MPARVTAFFIVLLFMFLDTAEADEFLNKKKLEAFAVWEGTDSIMTVKDLVAYCAPVFWFSPDEPELDKRKGKAVSYTHLIKSELYSIGLIICKNI